MTTLRKLRPDFTGIRVGEDDYVPSIEGGCDDVEIWLDKTNVDGATLHRISLLVEKAYDLGIEHTKKVVQSIGNS